LLFFGLTADVEVIILTVASGKKESGARSGWPRPAMLEIHKIIFEKIGDLIK